MAGLTEGLFASSSNEWETPQDLFDALDAEFGFNLDPCATPDNAKCEKFYTEEEDGLSRRWYGRVFVNPPYGREIGKWIAKARDEAVAHRRAIVVMLVPARTDTKWWHGWIMADAAEIRFIRGRLQFGDSGDNAPFPNAIIVFRDHVVDGPRVSSVGKLGIPDWTLDAYKAGRPLR